MLNFIQNNQIASTVVGGLIIAFILWLINRVRIMIASSKSDVTSANSNVDQHSLEETSLEQETNKEESFNLNQLQNSILLEFSEIGIDLRISDIMEVHEIRKTEAKFCIDELIRHEFLRLGGHTGDGAYYHVTPKGRAYLMNL